MVGAPRVLISPPTWNLFWAQNKRSICSWRIVYGIFIAREEVVPDQVAEAGLRRVECVQALPVTLDIGVRTELCLDEDLPALPVLAVGELAVPAVDDRPLHVADIAGDRPHYAVLPLGEPTSV